MFDARTRPQPWSKRMRAPSMVMTSLVFEKCFGNSGNDVEFQVVGAVDAKLRRGKGFGKVGQQLGEFLVGFGKYLKHAGTGVGGIVKAVKAVGKEDMAAHFAGEGRVGFFHLRLDQRVPGLPHYRLAAMLFDVVEQVLRAFHLGDDRRAGPFGEDRTRKQHHQFVTPDDPPGFVHDPDPVAVAVEGDAEIGTRIAERRGSYPAGFR